MPKMKTCLNCGEEINGRVDKKFCCDYCRNHYNNKLNSDVKILEKIRHTFESAGIEFIGTPEDRPGIRIGSPK